MGIPAQPSPSLPPLGHSVLVDDLPQPEPTDDSPTVPVAWALSDLPSSRRRCRCGWTSRPSATCMSSASRAPAARRCCGPWPGAGPRPHRRGRHLYGIDFAGGALSALGMLPHCGAVVPRGDTERVVSNT